MTGTAKWGWHNYLISSVNNLGRINYCYDRSWAWAAAENLYQWLCDNKHISKTATYIINGIADADKIAKKMFGKERGTALIFIDKNGQEPGHKRHFTHVAILGQVLRWWKNNKYYIYFYAHTSDRYGECYKPNGTFSDGYIQYFYKDPNYRFARFYIYYLHY